MQEKINHVTEYVTRQVPVVQKRIRTRYETVQALPPQDAVYASQGSGHDMFVDGSMVSAGGSNCGCGNNGNSHYHNHHHLVNSSSFNKLAC